MNNVKIQTLHVKSNGGDWRLGTPHSLGRKTTETLYYISFLQVLELVLTSWWEEYRISERRDIEGAVRSTDTPPTTYKNTVKIQN